VALRISIALAARVVAGEYGRLPADPVDERTAPLLRGATVVRVLGGD
jgi:hypothetical protein